jgi:hypothetical protein
MSKIIKYLTDTFYSKKLNGQAYVEHKPLIETFKSQKGNSKTTNNDFINLNNLDYIITST